MSEPHKFQIDGPEENPGNPAIQRPPPGRVSLPHEHDESVPFEESGNIGPVPGALFGLIAEYETADALIDAIHRVKEGGYRKMEAYTPFPVHEVTEALDFHQTWVPWLVLGGGIIGMITGYGLQYWTQVIAYPLNVGGRPFHSWPLFFPVTFEMTILFAAFAGVFGMLAMNGLPMPYHPVFNVERFTQVSRDSFFLLLPAYDPQFSYASARSLLASTQAREVFDVPH